MIPLQKSVFSQAFKRIICLPALLSLTCISCVHADERPLQQVNREAMAGRSRALSGEVDSLVVYKSKREMVAYGRGKKLKTYIVSLGATPSGAKHCEGDRKTPEGIYHINDKNPNSIYHKNLGISYPNDADRRYAKAHKLSTGGDVKIHGLPNNPKYPAKDYLYSDWTWGCIAVSNEEIDELYRFVKTGAVINILP